MIRALFSGLVCCFVARNVCKSRDPADPDWVSLSEWSCLAGYLGGSDSTEVLEDFLATQTPLSSVLNLTALRGKVQKVGVVYRAPLGSSHVVLNARRRVIQRSCTTALHVENLVHIFGQHVSINAPSLVAKIAGLV